MGKDKVAYLGPVSSYSHQVRARSSPDRKSIVLTMDFRLRFQAFQLQVMIS